MIPNPDTIIQVYADWVEFRQYTNFGIRIIHIHCSLGIPRVSAWLEHWFGDQRRREPLTLPLDEIVEYCITAAEKLGRDTSKLRPVHEASKLKPSDLLRTKS